MFRINKIIFIALLALPSFAFAASTFTMEEAVNRALENNNILKSVNYAVDASTYAKNAARSSFGPTISTTYGLAHTSRANVTSSMSFITTPPFIQPVAINNGQDAYQWTVKLSQPLFSGFALLNSYQKAALQNDNAKLQYENTKLTITGSVQENFLEYLKSEETVRSLEQALERVKKQWEVAKAFYDVGLRPNLDVMQAEVDMLKTENLLIQAQSSVEVRQAQLNALLAIDNLDSNTKFVGNLDSVPFNFTLDECLSLAYSNRPDVKMAKLAVQIGEKDKNLARSQFMPKVFLEMSYSRVGDSPSVSGNKASKRGGVATDTKQYMLAAQWDFFTSGKNYYNYQASDSNIFRLKAEESNLTYTVAAEVKTRLLLARDAEKRIIVAMKAVAQAQEVHRMALAMYQLQVGTSIDVLNALASLSNEESNLTTAKADYLIALSKLYIAMGALNPSLL